MKIQKIKTPRIQRKTNQNMNGKRKETIRK